MADKIASLYAEITADTKGLKRGLTEARNGLDQLKNRTDDAVKPIKTLNSVLSNIGVATAAAAAGIYALNRAFDFAKAGAEIEYTQKKFDRLSVSIGTTSDVLMSRLKAATRGLY